MTIDELKQLAIDALEELKAEEEDEEVDEKYVINEEDLDPSERAGGKAKQRRGRQQLMFRTACMSFFGRFLEVDCQLVAAA